METIRRCAEDKGEIVVSDKVGSFLLLLSSSKRYLLFVGQYKCVLHWQDISGNLKDEETVVFVLGEYFSMFI